MKFLILLFSTLTLFIFSVKSNAQDKYWTDFEHINDSLRVNPKPLMVFIHSDGCKYCKMQEHTTFADISLMKVLSNTYYCIKLNAENNEDITLMNFTFSPSTTDYHNLALSIGTTEQNKTLTFPTTIFLDPTLSITYRHKGFMSKKQMNQLQKLSPQH